MKKFIYNGRDFPAVKAEPPRERYLKLMACPETTGYTKTTVLFSHIPPGSTSGRHAHQECDEIIYCSGRGTVLRE